MKERERKSSLLSRGENVRIIRAPKKESERKSSLLLRGENFRIIRVR
jgi:hypothetical protein